MQGQIRKRPLHYVYSPKRCEKVLKTVLTQAKTDMEKHNRAVSRNKKTKKKRRRAKMKKFVLMLLLLIDTGMIAVVGTVLFITIRDGYCDGLRGKWKLDAVTEYDFNGFGSGTLIASDSSYKFRYRLDGALLYLDYADHSLSDVDYQCQGGGNNLVITNVSNNRSFELTKIEQEGSVG